MSEYVPTTDEVRKDYVDVHGPIAPDAARAEFDRWLAEVRANALEEAADAEADWTSRAWRSEEAETVVKLRKGLRARAARIREDHNADPV